MLLSELVSSVRLELQDTGEALYTESEVERALERSLALMSRFIPQKAILELTIGDNVTGETLIISGGTGTLSNPPIKRNSESVVDVAGDTQTRDTDYEINYLTGVITGLADASYTVSYNPDNTLLDISGVLSDCIKVEKVEYPLDSFPAYSIEGEYLTVKGDTALAANNKLRLHYIKRFVAATYATESGYNSHLDEIVITGAVGQSLLSKADYYTQLAATQLTNLDTVIGLLTALNAPTIDLTAPIIDLTAPTINLTAPTINLTAPTISIGVPSWDGGTLDISITPAPPGDYTVVEPGDATFPAGVTLPTDIAAFTWTDIITALDKVETEVLAARNLLNLGDDFINAVNAGDNVAENYGAYAAVRVSAAQVFTAEATERMRLLQSKIDEQSNKLNRYRTALDKYLGDITNYRAQLEDQVLEVNNFNGQVTSYRDQVTAKINVYIANFQLYREDINNYAAQVGEANTQINRYNAQIAEVDAKIRNYNAQIIEVNAQINNYNTQVREVDAKVNNYSIQVGETNAEINNYVAQINKEAEKIRGYNFTSQQYITLAQMIRDKGTAVLNQFYAMVGQKIEMQSSSSSQQSYAHV